ncbi:subunit 17 of mediator complex-domain-containing protein [Achaetomium macrosporum]|uniref:Mediator of RNA polymerase II transcription subunit 17 n=1 Tax=Achaetomium macrosporum TaxID=79813 RepID=A0AAN7CD78_9PEZI|nr:subunit 17 of mediator complex-domain-containing protein [Achaetomium macrosporum]
MNDRPFSLRPPPAPSRGPQSIADFIRRISAEPGGFRAVNSAELRAQVSARQHGTDGDRDVEMASAPSEAGSDVAEAKDVAAARAELLRAIHQTHQTSLLALDFVSLLLSKENPAQAVATFSPGLRDIVGIGTLGASMLEAPTTLAHSRVPDNKLVAIGKRLMDLNRAADTALAASKRLQREIGFETKYWSEVLAVSEDGWRTFRIPYEPQTMGVKFGFSNAAPEFKAQSIAPMRRAADGSVRLEHGRMGGGTKRLRVSILENGVAVGRSSLPRPVPLDAPLQDRVKESRDTIFARELWHEINREARMLSTRGVSLEDSAVTYPLDNTKTVSVQLVTLGEEEATVSGEHPGAQDALANWLCTTLSLLLSNAHRANEQRRSESSVNKRSTPPSSILAPLITYYEYDRTVQKCAQHLAAFTTVLHGAGVGNPTVTMKESRFTPLLGAPASTSLAALLVKPPLVQFDLTITPIARVQILLKPTPHSLSGATFSVSFTPPAQPAPQNPLVALSPLAAEENTRLEALFTYLHATVPCALAASYYKFVAKQTEKSAAAPAPDGAPSPPLPKWTIHWNNNGIIDYDTGEYGVYFDFGPNQGTGTLELKVTGVFMEEGKKVRREWAWPGADGAIGSVVKHVLSNGPPDWDEV